MFDAIFHKETMFILFNTRIKQCIRNIYVITFLGQSCLQEKVSTQHQKVVVEMLNNIAKSLCQVLTETSGKALCGASDIQVGGNSGKTREHKCVSFDVSRFFPGLTIGSYLHTPPIDE